MLFALVRADDCCAAQVFQKAEPHVCQRRFAVQTGILLHDGYDLVKSGAIVIGQRERLFDERVLFDQLGGGKSHRQTGSFGIRLDHQSGCMDAPVNSGYRIVLITAVLTEVDASGCFLIAGDVNRVVDQLINAFVLCG